MRRPLVVTAVVTVAFLAGSGAAWGWQVRAAAAAEGAASQERVATALGAGRQDELAVTGLVDRSAAVVGRDLLDGSLAGLSQAIPGAPATLDASAGRVSDDAVRQELAAAIAQAQDAVAGRTAPAVVDALAGRLAATSADVATAQREWEAARAAAAAAAARATASARASSAASTSAAPDPTDSCRTTYGGPAFYTSVPTADGDPTTNGHLPASVMTPVSWATDSRGDGYWLVTPATAALEQLDAAFRAEFGHHLDIDLAYRDLATQEAMYAALGPTVAAYPGTSNHGWGIAIDVPELPCEYGLHTPQRDWLVAHGPTWHWFPNPYEYWHFDYTP